MSDVALPAFGEIVLAGAVGAIALRAIRVREDRGAWAALAAGGLFWMAGDVYRLFAFPAAVHRFFPPPADAGYLLLYPFASGTRAKSDRCASRGWRSWRCR